MVIMDGFVVNAVSGVAIVSSSWANVVMGGGDICQLYWDLIQTIVPRGTKFHVEVQASDKQITHNHQ
jgi:hypothetical protein